MGAATDSVREKQTLHSQQLLSRYQLERDQRTRLISILARQLERARDMMPTWVEQRSAIRVVVARAEERVDKNRNESDRLLEERKQLDSFYLQKRDAVIQCLSREQEKAVANVQAKKRELAQSIDMEHETTKELMMEEKKNDELRAMLDQTVFQLENVQSEMSKFEAQVEFLDSLSTASQNFGRATSTQSGVGSISTQPWLKASAASGAPEPYATGSSASGLKGIQQYSSGALGAANGGEVSGTLYSGGVTFQGKILPDGVALPETSMMQDRARMEAHLREKEQFTAERDSTKAEIQKANAQLEQQRAQSLKMEDFVRRLLQTATASAGYLDASAKKEASAILACASKLQAAKLQRANSPA